MRPTICGKSLLIPALLLSGISVFSQDGQREGKGFSIPRTTSPPRIDGVLEPGEWDQAHIVSDLHQASPVEFEQPSETTRFYWTYDDEAIYVAAYAFDSDPESMSAYILNQGGNIRNEDKMNILINPYDNNRTAYEFQLNANGVRGDGLFSGTRVSWDWEGIWDGDAAIVEDGWTAEWEIPFKTLSFDPQNENWRVNMARDIPRYNEEISWLSQSGEINPTAMGAMRGITGVSQGHGLDLMPSVSSGVLRDRAAGETASDLNPSLDVNYKLTSSLNLLLTLNTDFAGTELDARQLNLERFNPSLPEKRTFFLTDFDIFDFGAGGDNSNGAQNGDPFASRRIGLSNAGEEVDIIGGLKLSGRVGSYDLGALVIRQEEQPGIEASDLAIMRLSRSIFAESNIGLIATVGDPQSNDDSSTLGIDYNYLNSNFLADRQLNVSAWYQRSDNEGIGGNNQAWHLLVAMPSPAGLEGEFTITEIQENFDPRLGFVNRTGARRYFSELTYRRNFSDSSPVQQYASTFRFEQYDYLDDGSLQSQSILYRPFRLQNHAGDVFSLNLNYFREHLRPGDAPFRRLGTRIPIADYSYARPRIFIRTSAARALFTEAQIEWGDFYTGSRFLARFDTIWQANRHFSMNLNLDYSQYDFPDVETEVTQVEWGMDFSFNSEWSLSNLLQYDTLSNNIGINSRLRWNIQPGRDLWLVLNHSMEDEDEDGRFAHLDTSATVKVRYTFRY